MAPHEHLAKEMVAEARVYEQLALRTAVRRQRGRGWKSGYDTAMVNARRDHARSLRRFAVELLDPDDSGLLGRAVLAELRTRAA